MAEKVSLTYIGGHDAVDIPDPDNGFKDIATDVKQGQSVDVPEDVAKSLLEQESNWTLTKAEKPKASEKDGK